MIKTAEECIQHILQDIERRKIVDFGDKRSVRAYNAAMDRIYKNGRYIDAMYPEKLNLLVKLLHNEDVKVVLTIATLVQHLHNTTREHRMASIHAVKNLLSADVLNPVEVLGCTWNIEEWERNLAE